MSDANRTQLSFASELVWGTNPATTMVNLRITDESLNYNVENISSNEIRSDRQISDLIQIDASADGGINFELSYSAMDDLLEGALWSDWVGVGTGATESIAATAGGYAINLSSSTNVCTLGASVTHGISAGQWIELTGSAGDDGYKFVNSVTGQALTIGGQGISTSEDLDTGAFTIKGAYLRNGVTEKSFVIERRLEDKTKYFNFLGMVVNSLSLTLTADSIITGSLEFVGYSGGTGAIGATYSAAPANDVMNAVANVGEIMEGATLSTTNLSGILVQEVGFTLTNSVRGLSAVGTLGNADIGVGTAEVNGTFNAYFENYKLYNKFIAATSTGLSFKAEDTAGNAYIFTFPRIKYSGDVINTPGLNSDVMENITFQAIRHATYDYTIQVCRFAA